MRKIIQHIKETAVSYYHGADDAITVLFSKNPCKKCIVKAACRTICEEKNFIQIMLYPWSHKFARFISAIVLGTPIVLLVYLIFISCKFFWR